MCKCPDLGSCPNAYKRVCGANGKTYKNMCHMQIEECLTNTLIGTVKPGSCGKNVVYDNVDVNVSPICAFFCKQFHSVFFTKF